MPNVVKLPMRSPKGGRKPGDAPVVQPEKLADVVLIRPDRSLERFFGSITGVSW